jgi:hypothetical protein
MNQKYAAIAAIVILLLSIGGYAVKSGIGRHAKTEKVQEVKLSDTEKADATQKAENVTVNPLLDSGSVDTSEAMEGCERYPDHQAKNDCYASEERDKMYSFSSIRECSTLKYAKPACEDYFYFRSAEKEKNPRYCAMIHDPKMSAACSDKVGFLAAVANTDESYCAAIKDATLQRQCSVAVKAAASRNSRIQVEEAAFQKASTEGDASACSALGDAMKVASCVEPLVTKNLDISLCKKVLTVQSDIDACYKKLSYDFDRAVIRKAYEEKNPALCDKAYDANVRAQCKQMKF